MEDCYLSSCCKRSINGPASRHNSGKWGDSKPAEPSTIRWFQSTINWCLLAQGTQRALGSASFRAVRRGRRRPRQSSESTIDAVAPTASPKSGHSVHIVCIKSSICKCTWEGLFRSKWVLNGLWQGHFSVCFYESFWWLHVPPVFFQTAKLLMSSFNLYIQADTHAQTYTYTQTYGHTHLRKVDIHTHTHTLTYKRVHTDSLMLALFAG